MGLGKYNLKVATLTLAVAMAMLMLFSSNTEAQSTQNNKPEPQAHKNKPQGSQYCVAAPDPELCEVLVAQAKTALTAVAEAVKLSIVLIKKLEPYVDRFIDALKLPPSIKNTIINTCHNDYQKVIENLSGALDDLNRGDKAGMNAKLSTPTMTKCVANLKQFHVWAPVVKKAKQDLDNYMRTCAAVAKHV